VGLTTGLKRGRSCGRGGAFLLMEKTTIPSNLRSVLVMVAIGAAAPPLPGTASPSLSRCGRRTDHLVATMV
jgi:hypothetical protein